MKYPAAKSNHHAFAGFWNSTHSIVHLAQAVAKQYPGLDASLLYAGALLHDLGKVIELTGPIATQYTTAGNLIGHIVLIDEQIVLAANEMNMDLYSEEMLLLRHTVLAHPLMESADRFPVVEANILHQLDLMLIFKALITLWPKLNLASFHNVNGRWITVPSTNQPNKKDQEVL